MVGVAAVTTFRLAIIQESRVRHRVNGVATCVWILLLAQLTYAQVWAQISIGEDGVLDQHVLEAHLRFLASDDLEGRKTGTPGNDVAARYIAEQFRMAGAHPGFDGLDYSQEVELLEIHPATYGALSVGSEMFDLRDGLVVVDGGSIETETSYVFAGFGLADADYSGVDAAGKIVVARHGRPAADQGDQRSLRAMKRRIALLHGAVALVELVDPGSHWGWIVESYRRPIIRLNDEPNVLPHVWVRDPGGVLLEELPRAGPAALRTDGVRSRPLTSRNVVGLISGTDPVLRDEFVAVTAHFDHLGAGMNAGPGATPADSIFNGARDNGMGVVALINTAYVLAAAPPRRSVLLVALTAEEQGILGSRYYVENPPVPLNRHVFALNVDVGGYSDTSAVTLIGSGRTTADSLIEAAAAAFGLTLMPDPVPEQNLFHRSDNVHFAAKGIPAPTLTPGFRSFDDPGISNYYHRPQDEVDENFDFAYLQRFCGAFTRAVSLIANADERPGWRKGDPYRQAGIELYGE